MDRHNLLEEVLAETRALLQAEAAKNRGHITLDPEIKTALEAWGAAEAPRATTTEAVATAPPPAPAPQPTPRVRPVNSAVADGLAGLAGVVSNCTRCEICTTRTQTVFGVGNPQADLVFVGEAPGADEDREGEPFVGAAGQLLTDIIVKGMKMAREDVYICNVIKCRPPGNRNPSPEEVAQCIPYLERQLKLVKPKIICALGKFAAHALLKTDESVSRMRGKWHDYQGIPLRVTYHPAYLLRKEKDKKLAWEDIQEVMKKLQEP